MNIHVYILYAYMYVRTYIYICNMVAVANRVFGISKPAIIIIHSVVNYSAIVMITMNNERH